MSEEQRDQIDSLIVKASHVIDMADIAIASADKAKNTYTRMIWTLIISIFVSVGTISGIAWQVVHQAKDIEYIRENAYARKAAVEAEKTYRANVEAVTQLIGDTETRKVVEEFNKKTEIIMNNIQMWNSEINPRGVNGGGNSNGSVK